MPQPSTNTPIIPIIKVRKPARALKRAAGCTYMQSLTSPRT